MVFRIPQLICFSDIVKANVIKQRCNRKLDRTDNICEFAF